MRNLIDQRGHLYKEMCDLNDIVEARDGLFAAEEQGTWDKLETDIADLDVRIDRAEKLEEARREPAIIADRADADLTSDKEGYQTRDQVRSWLKSGNIDFEKCDPEFRALQADVDIAGGYLVPDQAFQNELIEDARNQTYIRQLSSVINVQKATSVSWPRLGTRPALATWGGEISTSPEDSTMDFEQITLTPHKLTANIKVSNDLIQDSPMAVEAVVRDQFAYQFGITEETAFATGNGAGQPLGVFTANAQGISTDRDLSTGNAVDSIVADNLIRQTGNINPEFLGNATWLFHGDAINQIRRLKDGNGQYLLVPGLANGVANTILGIPYVQDAYAPNTFTSGLYVGILGDFGRGYKIVERLPFDVQRNEFLYMANDQVGFFFRRRIEGWPVLETAFTRVKLG